MIIYGTRASHLRSIQLDKEACPHCSTQGTITMSTYTRYAHVFWIPFFSVGRFSVSQCQHCKQAMEVKQMPSQIRAYHERNVAETRLPLWQFAGLFLLAVGIGFGIFADKLDKENQAQLMQTPMPGDVYELKTEGGSYTTFRVVNVQMDTLAVKLNNYEVQTVTGIRQLDKDENYSDSVYFIPVNAVREMFTAGEIVDINRQ